MENAEIEAVKKLLSAIALLKDVKTELLKIEEKFSKVNYYKKFRYNIDAPSIIPINVLETFSVFIEKSKIKLLEIDSSFNKNELPNNLKETYLAIFLILAKEGFSKKDGSILLGEVSGLWQKKIEYIVSMWGEQKYHVKAGYSLQAYEHIVSYLVLVPLIEELELKLLAIK